MFDNTLPSEESEKIIQTITTIIIKLRIPFFSNEMDKNHIYCIDLTVNFKTL